MNLHYFKISEFDQKGLAGSGREMKQHFLVKLDQLRDECGFPFIITSGYRSPEYNMKVSSSGPNGPHTQGVAVDVAVYGGRAYTLIKNAMRMGFMGIGIKQHGPHGGRFVHLDMCDNKTTQPRPWVWSY